MTSAPIWFGPADRPLFGMLHVPPGAVARAGVVLCSPFGREDLFAHSTYRALAERLEDLGIAVLRFDYDGTGDSAGEQDDPARVEAWSQSTRTAVELMRAAGPPVVAAVGMRMGAILAALEATRAPLDALVLWDPCPSGRAFLREQRALQSFSAGAPASSDGSVQTPGFRYHAETAAGIGALDVTATTGHMATRICVLTRPGRGSDPRLEQRLAGAGRVDHDTAWDQEGLLNADSPFPSVPERTVEQVATWLSAVAAPAPAPFDLAPFERRPTSAVVARDEAGRAVVERPVRIGDVGLMGILTELEGDTDPVTVVCMNTGLSRRIGLSRLWVDLARRWAGGGLRTLRVDLSGLGDSGRRPGQRSGVAYPDEALDDLDTVVRAVEPDNPSRVVLVGVCSGAFHALEGGLALGAGGVCVVNPVFEPKFPPPAEFDATPPAQGMQSRSPWRRAAGFAGRLLPSALIGRLPEGAFAVLHRVGLRPSPAAVFERLVGTGSDVTVVVSGEEALRMRRGARRTLDGLVGSGRLRIEVIDDLDHNLLGAEDRRRVAEVLSAHVLDHFSPSPRAGGAAKGPSGGPDGNVDHRGEPDELEPSAPRGGAPAPATSAPTGPVHT